MKDIMSAALVVGMAGGIIVILQKGMIIDTILHSLAEKMSGMGQIATVEMMYVIQNLINLVMSYLRVVPKRLLPSLSWRRSRT